MKDGIMGGKKAPFKFVLLDLGFVILIAEVKKKKESKKE